MAIQAGDAPTAAELRALGEIVQTIEKTADESLTSTTTFGDDDEITLPGLTAGTYEGEGEIWYVGTSASAHDIKTRWAWPSGSGGTFTWSGIGLHTEWANSASNRDVEVNGSLRGTTSPSGQAEFGTVTGANKVAKFTIRMTVAATGTLTLQWAPNTSNATALTVKAGTWLTLRKVA